MTHELSLHTSARRLWIGQIPGSMQAKAGKEKAGLQYTTHAESRPDLGRSPNGVTLNVSSLQVHTTALYYVTAPRMRAADRSSSETGVPSRQAGLRMHLPPQGSVPALENACSGKLWVLICSARCRLPEGGSVGLCEPQ